MLANAKLITMLGCCYLVQCIFRALLYYCLLVLVPNSLTCC